MKAVNGFSRLTIFPIKAPSQIFGWIPNVPPIVGESEMEVHGICNRSLIKREEIVRLNQAIRNLVFGDAEISLVVIQLGVTRLKKTGFVYLLAVVWRKGGEGVV